MANIITNANDVELVLEGDGDKVGSDKSLGRIVVDDFTITREEDDSTVSGVGFRLPAGLTYGDINFSFSFTMIGSDTDVFRTLSDDQGRGKLFSFTARKTDDNGNLEWEYALDTCSATTDEFSGSSGDPTEVPVEGVAVGYERVIG